VREFSFFPIHSIKCKKDFGKGKRVFLSQDVLNRSDKFKSCIGFSAAAVDCQLNSLN